MPGRYPKDPDSKEESNQPKPRENKNPEEKNDKQKEVEKIVPEKKEVDDSEKFHRH